MLLVYFLQVFPTLSYSSGIHEADKDVIKSLPGLNFSINFQHYSGFLDGSSTRFFHYWFTESQSNPAKDPLILWLNGGPGGSSLVGLLAELGPYLVNGSTSTLMENPSAWNRAANVLFIESPVTVGFSYATDSNTTSNDDSTAQENYEALKNFFTKHTSFRFHRLFIAGESYAGVYLPMLASKILQGQDNFKINLEGMAIGNGWLGPFYDSTNITNSSLLLFGYSHGMIDEGLWESVRKGCCNNSIEDCHLEDLTGNCQQMVGCPNYNIAAELRNFTQPNHRWSIYQHCDSPSACLKPNISGYLNGEDVKEAIHISSHSPKNWAEGNNGVNYTQQNLDMSDFIKTAIDTNVRVLLYYGDTDMVCNFLEGQKFAAHLGYQLVERKRPWRLGNLVAGYKTVYERNFTFMTVLGSGHMAPRSRAPEMNYAIQEFIADRPI